MIPNTFIDYLYKKLQFIFIKPEYKHLFSVNNSLFINVKTPNNVLYKVLLGKKEREWHILNVKNISLSKQIYDKYSVKTVSDLDAPDVVHNTIDIIKTRVYKDQGFPSFREIFQNSLGAADLSDPKLKHGATDINFILGNDENNNINSCMLIDNGVGMDLLIYLDTNNHIFYRGTMGRYLWTPTLSGKRKGVTYTANIEDQRIDTDIPGYLGIGFMSFASVWKKVAVLSKMKGGYFAFTINTNTDKITFKPSEEGYFIGFTFSGNIHTIEQLKKSNSIVYEVIEQKHGEIIKSQKIDLEISFEELPNEAKTILIHLFEHFLEKIYNEKKESIYNTSGTILFGYDPYSRFKEIFSHTEKVIKTIMQYTGFERITGFSDEIKRITGKPRKVTLTWLDKIRDISMNDTFKQYKKRGKYLSLTPIYPVEVRVMNPEKEGLTQTIFKEKERQGILKNDDFITKEIEAKFRFEAYVVPGESDNKYDAETGKISLLQNGIPVSPINLMSYRDSEKPGYRLSDDFTQLTADEEADDVFFTQQISMGAEYRNVNYNILINCNWIAVNMGRDGILNDFRYFHLKKILTNLINTINNNYMHNLATEQINLLFLVYNKESYVYNFYATFSDRYKLFLNIKKKNISIENWFQAKLFPDVNNYLYSIADLYNMNKGDYIIIITNTTTQQDRLLLGRLHEDYTNPKATIHAKVLKLEKDNYNNYDVMLFGMIFNDYKKSFKKKNISVLIISRRPIIDSIPSHEFMPLEIQYTPPSTTITEKRREEIREKDPNEILFMEKLILPLGKNILKYLIQAVQSISTNHSFHLTKEGISYETTKIYLPTKMIGNTITYERIEKFLKQRANNKFINPMKFDIRESDPSNIGFYTRSKWLISLNRTSKLYKKLLSIFKDENISKNDRINLVYILLNDFIIHEMSHEPVVALLISLEYRQENSHAFPEFADSMTYMQQYMWDFFRVKYKYSKKKTRPPKTRQIKHKKMPESERQSKIEKFFPPTTIILAMNNYYNNYNSQNKCKFCKKTIIPLKDNIYYCINCKRKIVIN